VCLKHAGDSEGKNKIANQIMPVGNGFGPK